MTSRVTMYKKPLERYLADKINELHPHMVKRIHICRVAADEHGCNWEIVDTIPPPTPEIAIALDREVISPVREMINLAD